MLQPMPRWKILVIVAATLLYALLVYVRRLLTFGIYVGPPSGRAAFFASIRWASLRDIAILTLVYGLVLFALLWRNRKA